MQDTDTSIDLSSTWIAHGKVARNAEGKLAFSVKVVPMTEAHGILTGPKSLRLLTRPLMSEEISQRHRTVELDLGVPVAFDRCTELFCWGRSQESAEHLLYIRRRSQ